MCVGPPRDSGNCPTLLRAEKSNAVEYSQLVNPMLLFFFNLSLQKSYHFALFLSLDLRHQPSLDEMDHQS